MAIVTNTKTITPEDEKTKIPAEEYDFSKVPEQERDACCYYEYARESLTVPKHENRVCKSERSAPRLSACG
jgi:hypothetical protein